MNIQEAIRKWKRLPKDEKYSFYRENILPVAVERLRGIFDEIIQDGTTSPCRLLVATAGHDMRPVLTSVGTFSPEKLVLMYNREREAAVDRGLAPFIPESCRLIKVPLDPNDHLRNHDIIVDLLDREEPEGTLCDITAGKNIYAVNLALAARKRGMSIIYLDAYEYLEGSGVPFPGTESIFIQHQGGENIEEYGSVSGISLSIHGNRESGDVSFQLDMMNEVIRRTGRPLGGSGYRETARELARMSTLVDTEIVQGRDPGNTFRNLARSTRNLFLKKGGIDAALKELKGRHGLRLVLDPDLAGVPWEVMLDREYGLLPPVFRQVAREEKRGVEACRSNEPVALVVGSGEGLPRFDELIDMIQRTLAREQVPFERIDSESLGALRTSLASRSWKGLIYAGHSLYTGRESGWLCGNGEVLTGDSLSVLSFSPPEVVISLSCRSARSDEYWNGSFGLDVLSAGAEVFIGTEWFLEVERARVFIESFMNHFVRPGCSTGRAYYRALGELVNSFGPNDPSIVNFRYYGVSDPA